MLTEGIIEVPDEFKTRIFIEVLKYVSTTAIALSDSPKHVNDIDVLVFRDYGVTFSYYDPHYDLTKATHGYNSEVMTYPSSLFKYAKNDSQKTLNFTVANLSGDQVAHKGMFSPKDSDDEDDILQINIHDVIEALTPQMQIKDFADIFDTGEDFDDFMQTTTIPIIGRIVKKYLPRMNATLEHELAHLIQYNFLDHPDQTKKNTGYGDHGESSYWTSPVEFSPQIISAARNFAHFLDGVMDEDVPNDFKRYWFKYLTQTATTDDQVMFRSKYRDQYHHEAIERLDNSPTFFRVLKNEAPSLHKKAVKLLYDELKKKNVL